MATQFQSLNCPSVPVSCSYTLIPKTAGATDFRTKNCPKVYNVKTFKALYKVIFSTGNPVIKLLALLKSVRKFFAEVFSLNLYLLERLRNNVFLKNGLGYRFKLYALQVIQLPLAQCLGHCAFMGANPGSILQRGHVTSAFLPRSLNKYRLSLELL